MAPVKFDDISKVATGILDDDYVVSGYVLKSKQKINWYGASVSSQVNLFADDKCATPAKLTFAFPKPFGCGHFSIGKLELDKSGKAKMEASKAEVLPNLKVELKSDLKDVKAITVAKTYTPAPNVQIKADSLAFDPKKDTVVEATYAVDKFTVGTKLNQTVLSGGLPDFGVRFLNGPLFMSFMASKKLTTLDAAASYTVNPEVKVAAKVTASKKGEIMGATMGLVCKGLYKAKVSMDQTVSVAAKYIVAKGVTLQGGAKYNVEKGTHSAGVQISLD